MAVALEIYRNASLPSIERVVHVDMTSVQQRLLAHGVDHTNISGDFKRCQDSVFCGSEDTHILHFRTV